LAFEEVSGIEKTEQKIADLLSRGKKYIWMSTGLNPRFYNRPHIKHAMTKALEKVKQFRLLLDVDIKERKKEMSWLFDLMSEKGFEIRYRKNVPHWLIVDGKHFRLEKFHPPTTMGVKNLVVYNMDFTLSEVLQYTFSEWWNNANPAE
jgi:hypothetical protein